MVIIKAQKRDVFIPFSRNGLELKLKIELLSQHFKKSFLPMLLHRCPAHNFSQFGHGFYSFSRFSHFFDLRSEKTVMICTVKNEVPFRAQAKNMNHSFIVNFSQKVDFSVFGLFFESNICTI